MNLFEAEMMAIHLMRDHGLSSLWKFRFDGSRTSMGVCNVISQEIRLSEPLTRLRDEDEVRGTLLHEIAHALEWVRHNNLSHGPKWKAICREIGAEPERCTEPSAKPKGKYTGICRDCGQGLPGYKIRKGWRVQPDGRIAETASKKRHVKCVGKPKFGIIDWYVTESLSRREAAQEANNDETKGE